ncbi:MAG: type II toxin-antitoxin system prevent-host-death family antitoxin [Longimicrobiales bacterium]|nr:type II toxin-antitoxin system prevent-host-death family antitoxin [Longimicrobiales bacterium]
MSKVVNIHEAKTHLSRLIRGVQSGEEVVIARNGEPVVRLVRVEPVGKRILGMDRGSFRVPDDFNQPLDPAVLADFEG